MEALSNKESSDETSKDIPTEPETPASDSLDKAEERDLEKTSDKGSEESENKITDEPETKEVPADDKVITKETDVENSKLKEILQPGGESKTPDETTTNITESDQLSSNAEGNVIIPTTNLLEASLNQPQSCAVEEPVIKMEEGIMQGCENQEQQSVNSKLEFPTVSDLNNRLRKLITSFQRNFKKEEIKNAQKAKRLERKEKIEQIVREREMQKLEMLQRRWSKKEENDFFKTISTFGVQRYKFSKCQNVTTRNQHCSSCLIMVLIGAGKYDWNKFRAISRLDKKFDDTLTEYFRAFYAMCKRVCGKKLSEEE
ncbi:Chromodomain-helicase-DNA-binding protein 8, partial [Orchesella cincta]